MRPLFDLTGKTAIVTGSTKGIGKAIAYRLAEQGAHVVISSRKADACDAVSTEINAALGRKATIPVPANIASKEALHALVEKTNAAFGQIDIVVCNAASNPYYGPLGDIPDEAFTKILQNNILSNNWLIAMTAPQMRARKDGAFILISSIGGLRGTDVIGAYAISKAADMQMARNLALEFGPDNVRINTIAPGLVVTDFARALWEDPARREHAETQLPMRRLGQPDDIAGVAVYLASPAASWTTGQTFVVDGGDTC
ncbi:MAG: SDR family NAD(P)-dependent oxidoreductase [Hyphomonadaceae bacterium]